MGSNDFTDYLAILRHELTDVLLNIHMIADFARVRQPQDLAETFRRIANEARIGVRMLQRSRFVSPQVSLESLPLRPHSARAICDAVADVLDEYRSRHDTVQLDFDRQFGHNVASMADLPSFREAISVLLGISIKFNPGKNPVRVAVSTTQHRETSVHIANCAQSPNVASDRLLEPYLPGANGFFETSGQGIEFRIAVRIAELHNAKITGDIRQDIVNVTFTLPSTNDK